MLLFIALYPVRVECGQQKMVKNAYYPSKQNQLVLFFAQREPR